MSGFVVSSGLAWACLIAAGIFEIGWALGLRYSDGFSRLWPSVFTLASMAASMVLLGLSLKTLPLGTAYAVWTGIGAVGTTLFGIVLFAEPATIMRLVSIVMIVAGIVGLKIFS